MTADLPERKGHLWGLAASPSIWAAHFLLSYAFAAVFCVKLAPGGVSFGVVHWTIGTLTVVALGAVTAIGWRGFTRHRLGQSDLPHDDDSPEDRHRFLGFATLLLSLLSAAAILYAALVLVFIGSCQ